MSIGFAYIASDCFKLDYCLEDSIRSVAPIADQISVRLGRSDDGTKELVYALQKELTDVEFIVHEDDWVFDRNFQKIHRTNAIRDLTTDWIFIIDADEMLHEKDLPIIKALSKNANLKAINFKIHHYFGLPHWIGRWPGWYKTHSRMFHKSVGVHYTDNGHCVCMPTSNGKNNLTQFGQRTAIIIHHYGHTRDSKMMGMKSARFKGWYGNDKDIGDGILPKDVHHRYTIPEAGRPDCETSLEKCTKETHPKQAATWFASRPRFIKWHGDGNEENILNTPFIKTFFDVEQDKENG